MKVCIFSLYAYPLFNQTVRHPFGGAEVRAWLLARGLAKLPGVDVSMVVFDHGQADGEVRDGVRMVKWRGWPPCQTPNRTAWFKWLARHLLTRPFVRKPLKIGGHNVHWRQLNSFERAAADVYMAFGVTNVVAELAAFCKAIGKPFILMASSDYNFDESYYDGSTETDLYGTVGNLGYFAITSASAIVAQTQAQADLCREEFERDATIIANPIDTLPFDTSAGNADGPVLWVGKSDRVKQPLKALELARKFPHRRFLLVMNKSSPSMFQRVLAQATDNVEVIEQLPFDEVDRLFASSFALLNTSKFEGFPNTFLQAGKYGVPIISLNVDPNGMLKDTGGGIHAAGSMDNLAKGLTELEGNPGHYLSCRNAVASYIRDHHALDDKVNALKALLTDTVTLE